MFYVERFTTLPPTGQEILHNFDRINGPRTDMDRHRQYSSIPPGSPAERKTTPRAIRTTSIP